MDGSCLQFPVATPPGAGRDRADRAGRAVAAHAAAVRAQPHQSVAARGRPGLDVVDTGFCAARDARGVGAHLRRASRRPADHPGHRDAFPPRPYRARRLADRALAGAVVDHREGVAARADEHDERRGRRPRRRDFARRAGLDDEASTIFAERQGNYRRGVPSVPASYRRIGDGSVIEIGGREWRVIIGEGHAPEHACLYCAETGVLIAGDQILPRSRPISACRRTSRTATRSPATSPRSRNCAAHCRPRSWSCRRTTCRSAASTSGSTNSPRITTRAATRSSPPATGRRAPPTWCRCCWRRQLDRHQIGFALGEALAHLHYLRGEGALAARARRGRGRPLSARRNPP